MATPVVFKMGTRAQYDALATKNPNALYFLTDTHELYHGDAGMAQSAYRSDIKTVEANDLEVISNYYEKNAQNNIFPVKGDIFAVKTHVADEKYEQAVYMYDGAEWQSISATVSFIGDNKSIEVSEDNVIALKDYGKRFYKFVEETGSKEDGTFVESHYDLVEVDEQNPWVAGLEPRVTYVDGDYVIGWYQPNLVTAEGVQDQVVAVQGTVAEVQGAVEDVKDDVAGLEELLNGTTDNPGGLVGEVEGIAGDVADITDVLYGAGEEAVGLIDDVAALEKNLSDNYYTKDQTYNRVEIDGKVSGVFHFKGTAESYDALPAEKSEGDVYQVGDKEYAWNGTGWVELGFVVDLSKHATKEEMAAAVKVVADDLEAAKTTIGEHADDIADHETRLVAVEGTLNTPETGLVAVAGDLQTRVGALEDVGAEKNTLVAITANGVALTPNAERIVNIPVFAGAAAGLVPVAGEDLTNKANLFLNAEGNWASISIGDLGEHASVTDYVDAAVESAMSWGGI